MKKSRLMRASVLLLVVALMLSLVNTTFSWFSRPQSLTGKDLTLEGDYSTSVNSDTVSYATYELIDEETGTYSSSPINIFNSTIGLNAGQRKCYRTDITNSGTDPQTVSLYLQSLTKGSNCDGIAIGVNGPSKKYKKPFESGAQQKVVSEIYRQNVYLGLHTDEVDYLLDNIDYVHGWNADGLTYNAFPSDIKETAGQGIYEDSDLLWGEEQVYNIYSVAMDSRVTAMKMKSEKNDWIGEDIQIYRDDEYYQTINGQLTEGYRVNNTMIFYEYDGAYRTDPAISNAHPRIDTFYSKATVKEGEKIDLKALAFGTSVRYSSSNTSVATVNSTTGVVTGIKAGTTTITVKSYGAYEDYISATCTLTVVEKGGNTLLNVPVVTNVLVEGVNTNSRGVNQNGVVSVYWYIKNDSETNGMTYTIPEIYLTL